MESVHELARKALDERWIPIRDAETVHGMLEIYDDTYCTFCEREKEICMDGAICKGCPLDGRDRKCCNGWTGIFYTAIRQENIITACKAAGVICELLQALLDAPDYDW